LDINVLRRRKYYAKKFDFKCEDCYRYKFYDYVEEGEFICSHYRELDQLEKEYTKKYLRKSKPSLMGATLLDFIPKLKEKKEQLIKKSLNRAMEKFLEKQNDFVWRKREIADKIVKCLNRRAYLAAEKGYYYFRDQDLRIAYCRFCQNYWAQYDFCIVYYELKNRRGLCPLYKFGKSIDSKFKEAEE